MQDNKKIPILMYHSISSSSNPKFKQFTVSPTAFAEQMAYIYNHKYTPLTVTQLVQARLQGEVELLERPIVLTFDDGFADFLTGALPVLQKYHFPATLYITTSFIGGTSRWLESEQETLRPMLTWQQVAEVSASSIECGAHTHTHPQLDTLTLACAKNEIESSKKALEDHLGKDILSFAYPFGYFTSGVRHLVQEAGFHSACAVRHAMSTQNDNPFSLTRLMVGEGTNLEAFAALISGSGDTPFTTIRTLYMRARTPSWQLIRRNLAIAKRFFSTQQKGQIQ